MTHKTTTLPTSPDSLEEMAQVTGAISVDLMGFLEKKGIDAHTVLDIILMQTNIMKWWASNYHRLIQEGKIPKDQEYTIAGDLSSTVINTQAHRTLDEYLNG